MPLRWKTTELETPNGKVRVTHWEKHDPEELIKAINRGKRVPSNHPELLQSKFGRHKVAVRVFSPKLTFYDYPSELFASLRRLVDKHVAIVEMPVAMVEHHDKVTLVTLWKDRTTPFHHFLADDAVSFQRKRQACLKIVRELAKLHANGFVHGHPKTDNFVVDSAGNPKFVDYTVIERATSESFRAEVNGPFLNDRDHFFTYLSNEFHENAFFSTKPEDKAVAHRRFIGELKAEYQKQYDHYASIRR